MAGCKKKETDHPVDGDGYDRSYRQISMEEAEDMMRRNDNHIIVDVRTEGMAETQHIAGVAGLRTDDRYKVSPSFTKSVIRITILQ